MDFFKAPIPTQIYPSSPDRIGCHHLIEQFIIHHKALDDILFPKQGALG